jgi:DNA-binding IclR family transcriptional regulator
MTTVQSVERAFGVLRSLSTGPAGVSEIAERTDLPKSTVSRLLSTLVDVGAVERRADPAEYGLGELIIDLSVSAGPERSLIAFARPLLEALSGATGEAAGLSVLDGVRVHYLDQVDVIHEVNVRDWTGESIDAHAVPSGLVMAAYGTAASRDLLFAAPLRAWTDHTVTDPVALAARLDGVRAAGYAWGREELSDGLTSVAAPILGRGGSVIAAIHVHAPSYRFPAQGEDAATAATVVDYGRRISERLVGVR